MKYISTRGQAPELGFEDVVLKGLADDGGLYIPSELPNFSASALQKMATLNYEDLAYEVMSPFVGGEIPETDFRGLIAKSYNDFQNPARAPLSQLGPNRFMLELYHGPTLAFKDFAMQLIGNLFQYILAKRQQNITIITATSGDTGSAALEAFKGLENVKLFILFPKGRVSEVQQRQMTTSKAKNVFPLAVEGDFDGCQALLKSSFQDAEFRDGIALGGVNSINWARVMAQIVYYFSAALSLGGASRPLSFSVPTGNFGDIYAGYLAKSMGLPIERLVIATNQNDILARTFVNGEHKKGQLQPSISPSMDIQISSNFERLLYDLYEKDAAQVQDNMRALQNHGEYRLSDAALARLRKDFDGVSASEKETKSTISQVYHETGRLICPHTAVGVFAAQKVKSDAPMIVLSTAHAAKFPQAVEAATGEHPALPVFLKSLYDKAETYDELPCDFDALKAYVLERV